MANENNQEAVEKFDSNEAQLVMRKLVAFFRHERPDLGHEGDHMNIDPADTAIHFLRNPKVITEATKTVDTSNWEVLYLISVVDHKKNWETMLSRKGTLPFFPVIGMSIDTGEGNSRVIHDVLWRADISELTVIFEDEENCSLETAISWGWTEHE